MDLEIINFGRLDAESDKSLMDYFVEIGSIKSILEGKHLVIGRKGSGKTAIFRYLELQLPKKNIYTINLELDNYYFNSHKQLKETGVPENNSYTSAWKLLISLSILGNIQEEGKLTRKEEKNFNKILKDLSKNDKTGAFNKIITWLKNTKKIGLPSFAGFGGGFLESSGNGNASDGFLSAVDSANKLSIAVAKKYDVTVLIDRIDDQWKNDEQSQNMIIGALRAVRDINLNIDKPGVSTVILFLRTDIWDRVSFNDRNKMRQDSEFLSWNDDNLIEVLLKRAQVSLSDNTIGWDDIFTTNEMKQRAKSRQYVLRRTMGRPRDIIAFASDSLTSAKNNMHTIIEPEDIYNGEVEYSKHVYAELKDEFDVGSSGWFEKFESIVRRIGTRSFNRSGWYEKALEVPGISDKESREIFDTMFKSSVIGVYRAGGWGGGSRTKYYYQDEHLKATDEDKLQIHPTVVKVLELVDR